MNRPEVGLPATGDEGLCTYATDLDQPTCGAPATTHIVTESPAWGRVGLSSCDTHLPVARAAGNPLSEHPWTKNCQHERWVP